MSEHVERRLNLKRFFGRQAAARQEGCGVGVEPR
jgi:hypothetical protein